jgi:predicted nucleotidyltransferase
MEDWVHEKEERRPPEINKNLGIKKNLTKIEGTRVDLVGGKGTHSPCAFPYLLFHAQIQKKHCTISPLLVHLVILCRFT